MNDKQFREMIIHIIKTDPEIRYLIQRTTAKRRFEEINGLERECTCQK